MGDKQSSQALVEHLATELMFIREGDLKTIGRMISMIDASEPQPTGDMEHLRKLLSRLAMAEGDSYHALYADLTQAITHIQGGMGLPIAAAPAEDNASTPAPTPETEAASASSKSGSAIAASILAPSPEAQNQDLDRELFLEFVEESQSHLQSIELDILALETDTKNRAIVDRIFRPFHTIKGVAGFLGLKEVHQVCHTLESLMDDARTGKLTVMGEVSDVVLEAVDHLKTMIEATRNAPNPTEALGAYNSQVQTFLNRVGQVHQAALHSESVPQLTLPPMGGNSSAEPASPVAAPNAADALPSAPSSNLQPASQPMTQVIAAPENTASPVATPLLQPSGPRAMEARPGEESAQPVADGSESVRVRINLLNKLMDLAGELVLGRNQLLRKMSSMEQEVPGLSNVVGQVDRVTSELQEAVMQTRMHPIGSLFSRFHRVTRDLARSLGKQMDLVISGEGVELDKSLIEALSDPLTHLIRNSADHAIEKPDVRVAAGKPATGTISLAAYQEGGKVRIKVADDGAGINLERVRAKAIERGLITKEEAAHLTERETINLIFEPGFSTAETVTGVSGRGVGMDVVRMNIERIGGVIDVVSVAGKGTTFFLDLPLTLAIVPALIVMTGGERFAIPQLNLLELVHLEGEEAHESILKVRGSEVFRLRGEMLPLMHLGKALKLEERRHAGENTSIYIVVLAAGKTRFGVLVDAIYDTEEIVVKPLDHLLNHIPVFAGTTLMGDGRPALILDVAGLARAADMSLIEDHAGTLSKEKTTSDTTDENQSILLFSIHPDEQFAVPLPLISRLEEVDMAEVQDAINGKVIRYRNKLLPLVFLEDHAPIKKPKEGREKATVLVFEIERNVGLVVTKIIDSLEMNIQLDGKALSSKGFNGMALVADKATAFVDIYQLIEMTYPEWFKREKNQRRREVDFRSKTILLAEDSNFYRTMEKNYLLQEGFKVVDVENGKLALEYLKRNKVDLLVTDIEMPEMNGFELSQAIRSTPELSSLPIIAVTSLSTEEDRQVGRAAGVSSYLVKLHKEELMQEIFRLLHAS